MNPVWFAIPSKADADKAQACIDLWRAKGYKVAIWRDPGDAPIQCDLLMIGNYEGYPRAVNALCQEILLRWPDTEWIVTGGDDTDPDPRNPLDIARECTDHFAGTFGVMQPTGDGHSVDQICGSPWLGADWCRRAHGGLGPFWPEYVHMFADSDLQYVTQKLGVLWQRPDLTHKHHHWTFEHKPMPGYMREANSPGHWNQYKELFFRRKAAGFPGSEPLPA